MSTLFSFVYRERCAIAALRDECLSERISGGL